MPIETQTKSKSLLGVSDLTLAAPLRRDLIPALDSRTYASRVRLLLRTLNALRISSLEAEPTPLIEDAVTRIRAIQSFRLAIIGNDPGVVLLAVAFDGGWEPYMRRIWRDLGPLLDVIFCNCEDYLTAHDHSFADYAAWVRRAQVDTEFFYNASASTVNDLLYLRETARRQVLGQCPHDKAPDAARDEASAHRGSEEPQRQRKDLQQQAWQQALPALTALYRLTDMYPPLPGQRDGEILLRAARHLLRECAESLEIDPVTRTAAERAAVQWFKSALKPPKPPVRAHAWDRSAVQGGIVEPYKHVTHGCLVLLHLADAHAAAALLGHLAPQIVSAERQATTEPDQFVNLAFTLEGLRAAGVDDAALAQMPQEFREGMAARAGILGDFRHNHPTQWALPPRNWPAPAAAQAQQSQRVQMSSVHAVLQFQALAQPSIEWQELVGNDGHPLAAALRRFDATLRPEGVTILSVQAMQRFAKDHVQTPRDHFGFVDGISQPVIGPVGGPVIGPVSPPAGGPGAVLTRKESSDDVLPGDLLLGYDNSLGDPPLKGRLWSGSTFVVIRKLKQNVTALEAMLKENEKRGLPGAEELKARMMGRRVDGENLVTGAKDNAFDYAKDPDGQLCPLQAHVRRANARGTRPDLTVPRILRRGMSYGPRGGPGGAEPDRGLVFMAYNASIAEQFELIQSWLSGGNSSSPRLHSGLRDPFLGVAQDGDAHAFVYLDPKGQHQTIDLRSEQPFVKLEWGLYAFVPSLPALGELQAVAEEAARAKASTQKSDALRKADLRARRLAATAQIGAALIARLRLLEQAQGVDAAAAQWKIALEDIGARSTGVSQALWAAIRQLHGGVLRTPYGVLVCGHKLVMEAFEDARNFYSVDGYAQRMRKSFGEIFLGMDRGDDYRRQSAAANSAIQKIGLDEAFAATLDVTQATVRNLLDGVAADAQITVEVKDIVDEVLARLSKLWFGLPDGTDVVAGGWHWKAEPPPTCPGHFHSPSRYMFQPNPGQEAERIGQQHGQELRAAVRAHVRRQRGGTVADHGPIGNALFAAIGDNDELASTLIGVMMGFLPTVDGNLRGTLYEWMNDRSLWDLQIAYLAEPGQSARDRAHQVLLPPLRRTLQLRPVPEVVWRKAIKPHRLGTVDIEAGDMVVLSIVSAMQEGLANEAEGDDALYPLFGGKRDPDKAHPTHACPGYAMALGVLLGALAGLLESATLRPTPSPMSLRLGAPAQLKQASATAASLRPDASASASA